MPPFSARFESHLRASPSWAPSSGGSSSPSRRTPHPVHHLAVRHLAKSEAWRAPKSNPALRMTDLLWALTLGRARRGVGSLAYRREVGHLFASRDVDFGPRAPVHPICGSPPHLGCAARYGYGDAGAGVCEARTRQRSTSATLQACGDATGAARTESLRRRFADRADPGLRQVVRSAKTLRWSRRSPRRSACAHLRRESRADPRSDEPGPDRALVVREVSRAQVAEVLRAIVGVARRQGTQPERRRQARLHLLENTVPARRVEHGVRERHREDLVGAERRVVSAFAAIDDVVAIATEQAVAPESSVNSEPAA